jgi:hypothetical protein
LSQGAGDAKKTLSQGAEDAKKVLRTKKALCDAKKKLALDKEKLVLAKEELELAKEEEEKLQSVGEYSSCICPHLCATRLTPCLNICSLGKAIEK